MVMLNRSTFLRDLNLTKYVDDGQSTTLLARNVWGLYVDDLVVRTDIGAGDDLYPVVNRVYSPVRYYDGDGNLTARIRYNPNGNPTILDAGGSNLTPTEANYPVLFTGQRHDVETGLIYFKARMWSAPLGRFLSRDPIGYVDGPNLFEGGYVPDSADPFGLQEQVPSNWYVDPMREAVERGQRVGPYTGPPGPHSKEWKRYVKRKKMEENQDAFNWDNEYGGFVVIPNYGGDAPAWSGEEAAARRCMGPPGWFKNPANENKPCCCEPPATLVKCQRNDKISKYRAQLRLELEITGCYKDLVVIWMVCVRNEIMKSGRVVKRQGFFTENINELETNTFWRHPSIGYLGHTYIRYLSCEGGKWVKKRKHISKNVKITDPAYFNN